MTIKRELPVYSRLLKQAREDAGLLQREVAELIGASEPTYCNAENGRGGPLVIDNIHRAFPELAAEIQEAWRDHKGSSDEGQLEHVDVDDGEVRVELIHGVTEAGLTRFFPSRRYYRAFRDGRESISSYISQAEKSVEMVSISLATGMELERVFDTFCALLLRPEATTVRISLLDYEQEYLMHSIAPVVSSSPATLSLRISDTLTNLEEFANDKLPRSVRNRFEVWCHGVIPNASAIILDGDSERGVVQLETKGYKMGMDKSFGFECAAGTRFFSDLRDSYRHLIADGRRII